MPNLLPDWTIDLGNLGIFNTREAGRLIWATLLLVVGIAFVVALIKPPVMKRPFPLALGIAALPVIAIGGILLGALITSLQRTIILATMAALVAHAFMLVISREPRDPNRQSTWAECFAGAVGVFALFIVGYAVVPHEWLTFANAHLEWGNTSKFVWTSTQPILGIGFLPNYPFNFDFPALRDIVVTLIYVVLLGLNLKLFVMWQKRFEVKPTPEGETTPARRSRFGRPLRRTEPAPEPATAGAAPEPS